MKLKDKIKKQYFISPLFLLSLWILLSFVNFIKVIPEPSIIGYLWKAEFSIAFLLFVTLLLVIVKSRTTKIEFNFFQSEIRLIILPFVLFVVWSALSVFWAYSWRNALHHSLLWGAYLSIYLLFRQAISDSKFVNLTMKVTGIVVFAMGMACIVEYLGDAGKVTQVFTFKWYKYGEFFLSLLPLFLAVAIHKNKRNSILAGFVVLSSWFVVLLTTSRTALISATIGVLTFFALMTIFHSWKKFWKKSLVTVGLLSIAFLLTQISFSQAEDTTIKRLAGGGHVSQSSLNARFLFWGIAFEAFKNHPLLGVGGDNYLVIYKEGRKEFTKNNFESGVIGLHEEVLPERAHNELLQILSELGIIGLTVFSSFIFGLFYLLYKNRNRKISPVTIGAIAGLIAFLISSLASAYSFRVTVNGVAFFFLLSIAVHGLVNRNNAENHHKISRIAANLILVVGLFISVALIGFSVVRGVSLMYLQKGLESSDVAESENYYKKAIALDSEDGLIRFHYGSMFFNSKRSAEAIPQMKMAIEKGIATSAAFYSLATTEIVAGNTEDAEKTFIEALEVYPKSVFLRTAYSSFLYEIGKSEEAAKQYQLAIETNEKQATSWQIAHSEGLSKLALRNYYDKNLLKVEELYPADAPLAVMNYQRISRKTH